MATEFNNVSQDLIWQVTRSQNSYLLKRKSLGREAVFSRDPLNLTNVHSKKHAGYAHDKAIGIQAAEDGGVKVMSKREKKLQKPAESLNVSTFGKNTPARKNYKAVANLAAKRSYRSDLRQPAVERVSAIRRTNKPVKPEYEAKLRGNKAKKGVDTEE